MAGLVHWARVSEFHIIQAISVVEVDRSLQVSVDVEANSTDASGRRHAVHSWTRNGTPQCTPRATKSELWFWFAC